VNRKQVNSCYIYHAPCLASVYLNRTQIPQAKDAKYFGMHLDKQLNWKKYIYNKYKHLGLSHQVKGGYYVAEIHN